MTQSKTFGRLLRMAVNGIAAYEGKNAPAIEDELGQQIGLSAAAIQRYKAGHLPPEPRTVQILAAAAVQRGRLDQVWLAEFLESAGHPAPKAILAELFPAPLALPPPTTPAPTLVSPDRNRARMIEKVQAFWIDGVLKQSLHGAVLLELGLIEQPGAVARPWDAVVQQPARPPRPLPSDRSLLTVFEELGGALLILGAPGSGKTTMLLELAHDLLNRARADATAPIPVVFNLSTWDGSRPDLAAWLLDELQLRYQVPRRVGQGWLAEARIVPLLDGLDEVAPEQREACVAVINQFHQTHGLHGLAVASRVGDYEPLATRLQLYGAVLIQPLNQAQIGYYLDAAGPALAGLRTSLRADASLRELAETPLMLSIMSLACRGEDPVLLDRQRSPEERRRQIFALYVERMFTRRVVPTRYTPAQSRRWLGWLAFQMRRQTQTVFAIEGLQPAWLPGPNARLGFAALAGALMGLVASLLLALGMAATSSLLSQFNDDISGGPGRPGFPMGLILGGIALFISGLALGGLSQGRKAARAAFAIGGGGAVLVLFSLLGWFIGNGAAWLSLLLGPFGILLGAIVGLFGGLLRRFRGRDDGEATIRLAETLHWSPQRALGRLAEGLLAGQILGLATILTIPRLDMPELTALAWIIPPLAGGLAFGLLAGLVGGLVGGEVEQRTTPNQGVHQSARHTLRAILAGPLVALALGPILGGGALLVDLVVRPEYFFAALGDQQSLLLSVLLPTAMLILIAAPLLGGVIGLASGGVTCLQHLALRALLWRGGAIPWDYAHFLDDAAERLFLRKVGGSYIFIHRLLLEHIAETDGAAWAERCAPAGSGRPTIRLGRRGMLSAPAEQNLRRLTPHRSNRPERPLRSRVLGMLSLVTTTALITGALTLAFVSYAPAPNLARTLESPRAVQSIAFADGGTSIVATSSSDVSLLRWNVGGDQAPEVVQVAEKSSYSLGMSVSPNGALYASFQIGRLLELRRSSDGTLLHHLKGYLPTFAPDGRALATMLASNEVLVWDTGSGAELARHKVDGGYITTMAFSPDGGLLAIGNSDNLVHLWPIDDKAPLRTIRVATEEQTNLVRDTRTYPFPWMAHISAVAFAPDGASIAVALSDGRIELRRAADGQLLATLAGHTGYVAALAFAPDGAILASGAQDRSVRLWRVADGAPLATMRGHLASIGSLDFSPDGQTLASGSVDHTVRLWRVAPSGL